MLPKLRLCQGNDENFFGKRFSRVEVEAETCCYKDEGVLWDGDEALISKYGAWDVSDVKAIDKNGPGLQI